MVKTRNLTDILRSTIGAATLALATLMPIGCGRTMNYRIPPDSEIAKTSYFKSDEKRALIKDIYDNPEKYMDEFYMENREKMNESFRKIAEERYDDKLKKSDVEEIRKEFPWIDLKHPRLADKITISYHIREKLSHMFQ